jgi:hypothetical protein
MASEDIVDLEFLDSESSDGEEAEALREQHAIFVKNYIWRKIKGLAGIAAAEIISKIAESPAPPAATQNARMTKRMKTMDRIGAVLSLPTMQGYACSANTTAAATSTRQTAEQMVQMEIDLLKVWPQLECPEQPEDLPDWYITNSKKIPCLAQAALALFGNNASSGGLECDLGSMSEVLAPKRASLKPGMVEICMFLKINKELMPVDPRQVVCLGKNWQDDIPKRPPLAEDEPSEDEIDSDMENIQEIESISD